MTTQSRAEICTNYCCFGRILSCCIGGGRQCKCCMYFYFAFWPVLLVSCNQTCALNRPRTRTVFSVQPRGRSSSSVATRSVRRLTPAPVLCFLSSHMRGLSAMKKTGISLCSGPHSQGKTCGSDICQMTSRYIFQLPAVHTFAATSSASRLIIILLMTTIPTLTLRLPWTIVWQIVPL